MKRIIGYSILIAFFGSIVGLMFAVLIARFGWLFVLSAIVGAVVMCAILFLGLYLISEEEP